MAPIIELLAEHGTLLLLGTTGLLAAGALVLLLCRAPAHRQRLGELALGATLVWLVLAVIPLPRFVHVDRLGEGEAPAEPRTTLSHNDPPTQLPLETLPSVSLSAQQELRPPNIRPLESSEPRQEEIARVDATPSIDVMAPVTTDRLAWRRILAGVYLWGVALHLAWLTVGRALLAVTQRFAVKPEPWLADLYGSLPPTPQFPEARVLVSRWCRRPVVYGLWRPTILLPARLCCQERAEALRCALLHELAHVARRDAWGNLLLNVACPVLYFHPLYWLLRRDVRFSRELIADDWAARFSDNGSYAGELLQLAADAGGMRLGVLGVLGVFRRQTPFYRRMSMLIERKNRLATRASRTCRWLGLLGCGAIAGVMICCLGVRQAPADAAEATHEREPVVVEAEKALEQPPEETLGAKRKARLRELTKKIYDALSFIPAVQVQWTKMGYDLPADVAPNSLHLTVNVPRRYAEDIWREKIPGSKPGEVRIPREGVLFEIRHELQSKIHMAIQGLLRDYQEPPHRPARVSVSVELTEADLPGEISIRNCQVALTTDFNVPARTEGTLVELVVQPGSTVKKGDLLARIDDEIAKLNLQDAKRALSSIASDDVSIRYAKAASLVAKYEHAEAVEINKEAPGAISQVELTRLLLAYEQGVLQLEKAEHDRESQTEAYTAKVAIAEAQLARHQILAPVDGVVVDTHARAGDWVKQGYPVCRIVDLQRLRVNAFADAGQGTPGDFTNREVTVQVLLSDGRLQLATGKITFVSPVIDTVGNFDVHAEIDNTKKDGHWLFRPGMEATIVLKETPTDK